MNKIIALLLLVVSHISAYAQESTSGFAGRYWKTDISVGDFLFSTFLTVTPRNNGVVLRSAKNADRRLFGFTKSTLGRLSGKLPKKGRLLVIKAKQVNDSVVGTARTPVLGHVQFRGTISEKDNRLKGQFIKDSEVIAVLDGTRSASGKNDYTALYPAIIDITQKNIFSKQMLETKQWANFDSKLKTLASTATDDIELFLGFNIFSSKLPFSHYNLILQEKSFFESSDTSAAPRTVIFEEKTPATAYMRIKDFSSSQKEIAATFPHIIEKGYQNLIIDLRDNGGGGIEAAMELARYVLRDSVFIGYFPTNRFAYKLDSEAALNSLPVTHATTTEGLIEELKKSPGVRLGAPKPVGKTFSGKIYVLTNKNTASTCEPIVYILKQKKIATIVGETTAGAMLSAAEFTIHDKYKLFMPIADFVTYDFQRIEKKGVAPDVETTSDEALDKAMALIQK